MEFLNYLRGLPIYKYLGILFIVICFIEIVRRCKMLLAERKRISKRTNEELEEEMRANGLEPNNDKDLENK